MYIHRITQICLAYWCSLFIKSYSANTLQLVQDNLEDTLSKNQLVLINFSAEWCRFSQMLAPIFDDAAKKIKEKFPEEGRVVLAKVDCDKETSIAQKFHVSKYPTIKIVRNGEVSKREYRGQRSVESIEEFVSKQLINPVSDLGNENEVQSFDSKKGNIVGYFEDNKHENYKSFVNIASSLRDDCKFHSVLGDVRSDKEGAHKIEFRKDVADNYQGDINDKNELRKWISEKCTPFVREITFTNAEELTEEGLPFVILFHNPSDEITPAAFRDIVSKELIGEKGSVNFLTADGNKFSHPLHHLGKSVNDLPVLAIDSFRHMYVWKRDAKNDISKPGYLKTFIADLHSGKLHREFHNGPDPTVPAIEQSSEAPPIMRVVQQDIKKADGARVLIVKIIDSDKKIDAQLVKSAVEDHLENMADPNVASTAGVANEGGLDKIELSVNPTKVGDDDADDQVIEEGEIIENPKILVNNGKVISLNSSVETIETFQVEMKNVKTREFLDNDMNKVIERSIDVRIPSDSDGEAAAVQSITSKREKLQKKHPPKSMFQHLLPSRDRYTFTKDEL